MFLGSHRTGGGETDKADPGLLPATGAEVQADLDQALVEFVQTLNTTNTPLHPNNQTTLVGVQTKRRRRVQQLTAALDVLSARRTTQGDSNKSNKIVSSTDKAAPAVMFPDPSRESAIPQGPTKPTAEVKDARPETGVPVPTPVQGKFSSRLDRDLTHGLLPTLGPWAKGNTIMANLVLDQLCKKDSENKSGTGTAC